MTESITRKTVKTEQTEIAVTLAGIVEQKVRPERKRFWNFDCSR
jgi:hypothetical protein